MGFRSRHQTHVTKNVRGMLSSNQTLTDEIAKVDWARKPTMNNSPCKNDGQWLLTKNLNNRTSLDKDMPRDTRVRCQFYMPHLKYNYTLSNARIPWITQATGLGSSPITQACRVAHSQFFSAVRRWFPTSDWSCCQPFWEEAWRRVHWASLFYKERKRIEKNGQ